jgi:hypothetical protein
MNKKGADHLENLRFLGGLGAANFRRLRGRTLGKPRQCWFYSPPCPENPY